MQKKIIYISILALIAGCSTINPTLKAQSDKEMAIWNDPNIPADTKREILKAMYLERTSQQATVHDPTEYRPIVDSDKCPGCPYEKDLATCRNIASENTNYANNTLGGAAAGAATGAILCAVAGLDAGTCAVGGATGGAIGGLGSEVMTSRQIIARCMQGRGYNVLR